MNLNAPYDPFSVPMPSLHVLQLRARRRAHADTLAKMAALPSDAVLRQANASLVNSMNSNLNDFRGLAQNLGGSYAAAVAPALQAQQGAAAQLGAVGATPAADTRGGLIGALGANTYAGLVGNRQAAQAGLSGQLTANAGKRGALAAGENSLYESYLSDAEKQALTQAAARSNALLAAGGQNIDQQNANSRSLTAQAAASRADTARRKLEQQKSGLDPATQRILDSAFKVFNDNLAGKGTTKKTIAGIYHFKLPAPQFSGAKDLTFDVRAANGTEARTKAQAMLTAQQKQQYAPQGWLNTFFTGMDPVTGTVANPGKGAHYALQQAIAYLQTVGGMDHASAVSYARQWVPKSTKPKKKKAKPAVDHVGGPH